MPRPPAARAFDELALFVVVARQQSFVEASRRTGVPTSTVSRAVLRLEEDLGVRLLHRTSRQVTLTDEGRQLLLLAAPHVDGLEEALASTAERRPEASGVVRVTAPAYTGSTRVAAALGSFAVAHPGISVELDASNVLRDLVEEGFDFGVRVGPLVDADFVARRLWEGHFGLFAAPALAKSTLGRRAVATREDLERAPCVVLRSSMTWRFRDAAGRGTLVKPCVRFAVNDPRAAVEVARQGVGFVVAPLEAVARAPAGLVAVKTDLGAPEPVELFVVYPTRRLLPQRVRLAIDWLASEPAAVAP